jgi:hypothetical protein
VYVDSVGRCRWVQEWVDNGGGRVIFITFPSSQLFLIPKTLAFDQFHHVKIDQFSNHYLSKNSFTI